MLVTADLLRAILLLPLLFAHTASTIWLVYPIASTAGARFGILPILDTMAGLSLLAGVLCLSVARLERRPMNRIGKDRLPPVRMRV